MTTAHYYVFTAQKEGVRAYVALPSRPPQILYCFKESEEIEKTLEELAEHVVCDALLRYKREHFSVGFTYAPPSPLQVVEVEGVGEMNTHELDLSLHQTFYNLIHDAYRKLQNPALPP